MRGKVTDEEVSLPKQWFQGADEVEIPREKDRVVVIPIRQDDPIMQLGIETALSLNRHFEQAGFQIEP